MEASGAGLATGSDGADGGDNDGQEQQAAGAGGGNEAIAQLSEQLTTLSSGQDQMREFLEGLAQQQGGEQEGQQEERQELPDLSVFDESRPGYSEQQAAEALQQLMQTEADRRVQEAVGPLQERVDDMQRDRENDALIAKYSDLGDEKVAQSVVDTAQRYAAVLNQPGLVQSPKFVELVYLAGRATELAQQQQDGAADGAVATLEGVGGARPGGAGQGADPAAAIKESWGQRGNVLSKL
jgi:hypothetical protein